MKFSKLYVLAAGQNDDHLRRAFGECPLDRLWNMDFLDPLVGAD
jgi:hypothetical protein